MHKKSETLFCFSPLVMISTFTIELALAVYVLWKYRHTLVGKVSAGILVCLAIFQLAEWMVCEGALGMDSITWSRIGFVAITFLPALGLHNAHTIAGRKGSRVPILGYTIAVGFSLYFLAATNGLTSALCGGNYVIFEVAPQATTAFSVYYYLTLLAGIGLSLYWAHLHKNKHVKRALRWIAVGYATFMIPTAIANTIDPATLAAIPSIMCGFAILYAFALAFGVMPAYAQSRAKR